MPSLIKREYDYAIRICAYLAGREDKSPVPLPKMAKALFISKPFATKIVHQLKISGITGSVQGKTGGIFLEKDPSKLSLFTILEAMGFNSSLNECIKDHRHCPLIRLCHIHDFFVEAEIELFGRFQKKMISELAIRERDLSPLSYDKLVQ